MKGLRAAAAAVLGLSLSALVVTGAGASTTPVGQPMHVTASAQFPAASPLVTYCTGTYYGQVQINNPPESEVAQWNASDNFFITPTANHTIFCAINEDDIGGSYYYEFQAVLNGHLTNDCLSVGSGAQKGWSVEIKLNGCQAGKAWLLWAQVTNPDQLVNHLTQNCAYSDGNNDPFITYGTGGSIGNGGCFAFDPHSDWYSNNNG